MFKNLDGETMKGKQFKNFELLKQVITNSKKCVVADAPEPILATDMCYSTCCTSLCVLSSYNSRSCTVAQHTRIPSHVLPCKAKHLGWHFRTPKILLRSFRPMLVTGPATGPATGAYHESDAVQDPWPFQSPAPEEVSRAAFPCLHRGLA